MFCPTVARARVFLFGSVLGAKDAPAEVACEKPAGLAALTGLRFSPAAEDGRRVGAPLVASPSTGLWHLNPAGIYA